MTVWTHQPLYDFTKCETACGKYGCITIYTGDGCFFCDAACELLKEVVSDFGLPYEAITLVDADTVNPTNSSLSSPVGLPTIQICNDVIVGLPDIDAVRGALMHAVLKGCFSD